MKLGRKRMEKKMEKISKIAQAVIDMNNLTETMSEKLWEFFEAYKEVRNKQMEISDLMMEVLEDTKYGAYSPPFFTANLLIQKIYS